MCNVWGSIYHIFDMSKLKRNSFQASWILIVFYKFWLLKKLSFYDSMILFSKGQTAYFGLSKLNHQHRQLTSANISVFQGRTCKLSICLKNGFLLLCSITKIDPQLENKVLLGYTLPFVHRENLFETTHIFPIIFFLFKIVCIMFLVQLYRALFGID